MYQVAEQTGDTIAVPQLIFSRLTFPDMSEARFRVALYLLANGTCDAQQVAAKLHINKSEVEKALEYWEGAGLLVRIETPGGEPLPKVAPPRRKHMTSDQVTQANAKDASFGPMMQELQYLFGGIIGEKEHNIFATLYWQDGFAADLILTATISCIEDGKISATRVEKTLFDWQKQGINDCADADRYLKLLAERAARYTQIAQLLDVSEHGFTLAEKRRIDEWYEKYDYNMDMIQTAQMDAGEKRNDIRYLNAILKKWHAKGYKTPQDVRRVEQGRNLQVQSTKQKIAPENDILLKNAYIPLKDRRKRG